MKSLISMLEIADVVCEDAGDITKRYRTSILRHMATCYRKLQIFVDNEREVETQAFPFNNVIEMPKNFIYPTKVGIKYGDRVALLDRDWDEDGLNSLNVTQTGAKNYVGAVIHNKSYDDCRTPFYNYRGEIIFGYGPGIKCDGMYTFDKKNGRILLGSEFPVGCEVIVEYVSDGVSQGQKMVPIEMYDALYNYATWKFFFQRGDGRWTQAARDYDESYYQLEMLYKFVPINYIVSLFQRETHTINDRL